MRQTKITLLLITFILFQQDLLNAQDSLQTCKVLLPELNGKYSGDCKNGLANGKGEASGIYKYTGSFKDGLPNGKGTLNLSDSIYFTGQFQEGIKEGKGELHHLKSGSDSVVKGYWSGGVYRGKNYTTFNFFDSNNFDSYDIRPSSQSGNTITIEILSNTGTPGMSPSTLNGGRTPLLVIDLYCQNGDLLKKESYYHNSTKSSITYEILNFPVTLIATLSNGKKFELELYKKAKWIATLTSAR